MKINRLLANILSADLEQSKLFYTSMFAFRVDYDSNWFVHLVSEGKDLELGILSENHEIVPQQARGNKSGIYLTFVVDDVSAVYQKAQRLDYEILQAPEETFYGQRRMLLVSPDGTICDVSAPVHE